jgi:hypothetical protein
MVAGSGSGANSSCGRSTIVVVAFTGTWTVIVVVPVTVPAIVSVVPLSAVVIVPGAALVVVVIPVAATFVPFLRIRFATAIVTVPALGVVFGVPLPAAFVALVLVLVAVTPLLDPFFAAISFIAAIPLVTFVRLVAAMAFDDLLQLVVRLLHGALRIRRAGRPRATAPVTFQVIALIQAAERVGDLLQLAVHRVSDGRNASRRADHSERPDQYQLRREHCPCFVIPQDFP